MNTKVTSSLEEIQHEIEPLVAAPDKTAIFLDLDGTLAPIVSRPADVAVPPAITTLVRRLARMYLAIAIVSGRQATEARRIVGLSELTYIGNHGFETMLPGQAVVVSGLVQPYLADIRELVKYCHLLEDFETIGVSLESKTATISLHYRRAPEPAVAKKYIKSRIAPKAKEMGLRVNEGRMVFEIKPPEKVNKGVAVRYLIDRLQAEQALYAGDDTTDIDALRELRRRRQKNQVMVGVGVVSGEMPANLPKYSDLLVGSSSGVEMLLQILTGEEP